MEAMIWITHTELCSCSERGYIPDMLPASGVVITDLCACCRWLLFTEHEPETQLLLTVWPTWKVLLQTWLVTHSLGELVWGFCFTYNLLKIPVHADQDIGAKSEFFYWVFAHLWQSFYVLFYSWEREGRVKSGVVLSTSPSSVSTCQGNYGY